MTARTSAPHGSKAGRAARRVAPRAALGDWEPRVDRANPVALLEEQAASRVPELIPIRYGRMMASPFAFYRGAAAIMAADLATMPASGMRVQLCGDAHLANFGAFASPERRQVFDAWSSRPCAPSTSGTRAPTPPSWRPAGAPPGEGSSSARLSGPLSTLKIPTA